MGRCVGRWKVSLLPMGTPRQIPSRTLRRALALCRWADRPVLGGLASPSGTVPFHAIFPMYPRLPQQQQVHHRITWSWLAPDSVLRAQLERLAGGAIMENLPELQEEVAMFRFVSLVERIQEGDHSLVNRHGGKRRVSAAYVSLVQRWPELARALESRDFKEEMFRAFGTCKYISDLSHLFRFHQHPDWRELVGQSSGKKGKHKMAVSIVYTTDVISQNVKLGGARKLQRKRKRMIQKQAQPWLRRLDNRPKPVLDSILKALMLGHLEGCMLPLAAASCC